MKVVITGRKTYSKKCFKVIANTEKYAIVNCFGFGLWVFRKAFGDCSEEIKVARRIGKRGLL